MTLLWTSRGEILLKCYFIKGYINHWSILPTWWTRQCFQWLSLQPLAGETLQSNLTNIQKNWLTPLSSDTARPFYVATLTWWFSLVPYYERTGALLRELEFLVVGPDVRRFSVDVGGLYSGHYFQAIYSEPNRQLVTTTGSPWYKGILPTSFLANRKPTSNSRGVVRSSRWKDHRSGWNGCQIGNAAIDQFPSLLAHPPSNLN